MYQSIIEGLKQPVMVFCSYVSKYKVVQSVVKWRECSEFMRNALAGTLLC